VVQILVNFLSNAAKYASEGTPIIIDVTVSADSVRFGVKNDGPGFSEEQRKRLFRRFGLLSASDQSSTGLGLYICAELVALMGGTIGCESEPHRITTFWFTLPRAGA
ncbi:MAG: ATP-binding protein, partial [Candidatus Eremiobacteraeota bacterium]|nr:ATP-binding protein [Candidatus Eremiobacteraeota bacterium]